ncbi:MAG TPA: type II toxin-antitoxin system prevent-host-death family antitoxin [Roseiarcus sp.]|nr:type II toxin-antitoxin system prevent-host-death family antitoxin [Roseiarcus sp.]
MTRIGAYEAKTRLSELLDRAERGEEFEITKNGRPVAKIVGLDGERRRRALAAAARMKARLAEAARREPAAKIDWDEFKKEMTEEEDAALDAKLDSWRS